MIYEIWPVLLFCIHLGHMKEAEDDLTIEYDSYPDIMPSTIESVSNDEKLDRVSEKVRRERALETLLSAAGYIETEKIWSDQQCEKDTWISTSNIDDCKTECDQRVGCNAFQYAEGKGCALRKCPEPVPEPTLDNSAFKGFYLADIAGGREPGSPIRDYFATQKIWTDAICASLTWIDSVTTGLCEEKCDGWDGCNAFSYAPGRGCYLRKCPTPVPTPTQDADGFIGYYTSQAAQPSLTSTPTTKPPWLTKSTTKPPWLTKSTTVPAQIRTTVTQPLRDSKIKVTLPPNQRWVAVVGRPQLEARGPSHWVQKSMVWSRKQCKKMGWLSTPRWRTCGRKCDSTTGCNAFEFGMRRMKLGCFLQKCSTPVPEPLLRKKTFLGYVRLSDEGNKYQKANGNRRYTSRNSDVCQLPSETGPCRAYFERFFFSTQTQSCEKFVFGGCGGNGNNFETLKDCKNRCDKKGYFVNKHQKANGKRRYTSRDSDENDSYDYGRWEEKRTWSSNQCDRLGFLKDSILVECMYECDQQDECTAFNYARGIGCYLLECPLPLPRPEWRSDKYRGYYKLQAESTNGYKGRRVSVPTINNDPVSWEDAVDLCHDKGMDPFVPHTNGDYRWVEKVVKALGGLRGMWLPATDYRTKGMLMWSNGQRARGVDSEFSWFAGDEDKRDRSDSHCLELVNHGKDNSLIMTPCDWQRHPMICIEDY